MAIMKKDHVLIMKKRPDGMMVVQQQGMEVLGVNLSLSMSFKDRYVVRPHVMLNVCLSLSWQDNSFRPRSRVAQLRPEDREVKVRTLTEQGLA